LILLYLIGFVAGIVAGISPCILPVLPVILVAGVTKPAIDTAVAVTAPGRYRAYAVIGGLIVSFSVVTLAGTALLKALGLPLDFLRDAGLAILGLVALGLIVPALGHLLERPFARFGRHQPTGNSGPFVLGLGLARVELVKLLEFVQARQLFGYGGIPHDGPLVKWLPARGDAQHRTGALPSYWG